MPDIDESLLWYIESEISYLKSIDTIAEDLSGGGILDSNFKVTFTVRQLAIFIHLQVEAGIITTQSPKALHQYITKHYSTAEKDRQRLLHTYADRAEISSGLKGNYFEMLITINLAKTH